MSVPELHDLGRGNKQLLSDDLGEDRGGAIGKRFDGVKNRRL